VVVVELAVGVGVVVELGGRVRHRHDYIPRRRGAADAPSFC
jgi:hypothetical protein